ncbi:MaoC/PaaZ C-terminal domain-containing protein [Nocardioides panacihumi]|uniref:MaoC/PaaZ C-terminal domain-containing protein n=1 Tax=Nocardioides panacihumi TaxID=400774 RepID=A0ABP5CBN4_9ACTN
MPIDPDQAIGAALPDQRFSWTSSDVLLYHLAVGAGHRADDPVDPAALRLTYDDRLQVLPSFGIVAPGFHRTTPPALDLPGCDIDLAQVLHGSQSVTVHGPIPTSGSATLHTRVADVWDKGKAAVIVQSGTAVSDAGDPLWTVSSAIFVRGEGGWGGDRGPSTAVEIPHRVADAEATYAVLPQQALLYRLCGDRNPLHADPAFAARAGFPRPILHGLCSYGIVLREVADLLLDGDVSRIRSFTARFSGIVFPGETIRVEAWDGAGSIQVRATIAGGDRDGSPVLSDCVVTAAGS